MAVDTLKCACICFHQFLYLTPTVHNRPNRTLLHPYNSSVHLRCWIVSLCSSRCTSIYPSYIEYTNVTSLCYATLFSGKYNFVWNHLNPWTESTSNVEIVMACFGRFLRMRLWSMCADRWPNVRTAQLFLDPGRMKHLCNLTRSCDECSGRWLWLIHEELERTQTGSMLIDIRRAWTAIYDWAWLLQIWWFNLKTESRRCLRPSLMHSESTVESRILNPFCEDLACELCCAFEIAVTAVPAIHAKISI